MWNQSQVWQSVAPGESTPAPQLPLPPHATSRRRTTGTSAQCCRDPDHLSSERASDSRAEANIVLREPSTVCSAAAAPPSAPFMPTRLTIALASVSRIIPTSSISSIVISNVSKLSSSIRFSGGARSSVERDSCSALSTLTRTSSFSLCPPTTYIHTSLVFRYTVTKPSIRMISASFLALVRAVLSYNFFSNAISSLASLNALP
mmetsp:Transcript_15101/g.38961  ORF Transcript_15101/g.38961 Transcript_15101/m.38961 type:complete len:204 (+) Transcript_15101:459-1070(+)